MEIADPSESKSVERFGSWGSGFSPVAESVSFWTGGLVEWKMEDLGF